MIGGCTNYLATMPEITVYMNCDTRLAINLRMFDLGDNDEFIFAIKNYNYIDSGYVYLYRARNSDINPETGEVVFKITPRASKRLKPGAFYNFALLANAYDKTQPTEYKKLTENGSIHIEYGAQDMLAQTGPGTEFMEDIIAARLAPLDTVIKPDTDTQIGEMLHGSLKEV
jgi:hypothetical protein